MLAERIELGALRELAERRARGELQLGALQLPRLRPLLAPGVEPQVSLQVTLAPGADGQVRMDLQLAGELPLICQRCLEPLHWPVDVNATLTVLRDEADAELLADPFDTVVAEDGWLDLRQVVEDELLAALPMAPLHPATTACGQRAAAAGEPRVRPFAGLASLLDTGPRPDSKE